MKISIIIPTRERAAYLRYAIQTALAIDDDKLEIVVCDNASCDDTKAVVHSFTDPRIRYVNTGARISMRANFNHALMHSSGDYVIFFGDDDGIVPKQFKYLRRLLETHRPDGISWNRASYGWPDADFAKKTGGVRFYRHSAYGAPYIYDPQQRSLDALMGCRLGQLFPVTPNIYHGCVARAYLDKVAPAKGLYFDSVIPDVNFEYRATMLGGNFLHADHPFSINGYSPVSNGGAQKGFAENDPRSKPARQFEQENQTDPYLDIMENARFVPLAFMATLETVRKRMGYTAHTPDILRWYRYITGRARRQRGVADKVNDILQGYAEKTDTVTQLETARNQPVIAKRTLGERLSRIGNQIASFRVSAAKDGQNTILSAAHVYDDILGDQYGAVLQDTDLRRSAWKAARKRSKAYTRQL